MRTVIVTHTGLSDHLNLNGMIRFLQERIPGTLILVDVGNCKEMLEACYSDLSNVEVFSESTLLSSKRIFNDTYLVERTNADFLHRIGFGDPYLKTSKEFLDGAFIDAFYLSQGLPTYMRYTNFKIPMQIKEESKQIYSSFCKEHGESYIVIHEDPGHTQIGASKYLLDRGSFQQLRRTEMKQGLPIINLDRISKRIIDYYEVLLHAEEIHCIDSVWANFVYILSMSDEGFQSKKVVLHDYARSQKNPLLYTNPLPPNWTYLRE